MIHATASSYSLMKPCSLRSSSHNSTSSNCDKQKAMKGLSLSLERPLEFRMFSVEQSTSQTSLIRFLHSSLLEKEEDLIKCSTSVTLQRLCDIYVNFSFFGDFQHIFTIWYILLYISFFFSFVVHKVSDELNSEINQTSTHVL